MSAVICYQWLLVDREVHYRRSLIRLQVGSFYRLLNSCKNFVTASHLTPAIYGMVLFFQYKVAACFEDLFY
jgi:hypothetical protein